MGRMQSLSILNFFKGIWNFSEIFLWLCIAFWLLPIADLSKKTRFLVFTTFRWSFGNWKNIFADGIFHSFAMNALIRSRLRNSNKSPIHIPFIFLETFEPLERQPLFGALYLCQKLLQNWTFNLSCGSKSGFPNNSDRKDSSDLLQKIDPSDEGIESKNEKGTSFLSRLNHLIFVETCFFFIHIVLGP